MADAKPTKIVHIESAAELGAVSRERVLRVLRDHDVAVKVDDENVDEVTIISGAIAEAYSLPDPVRKRMLHRFARIFGIPIAKFY
jgi:hypothetical protein